VALAVHVSEKLRGDATVMAQVQNNPKDQAMKANLPGAAVQAIVGAMETHKTLATRLLSDQGSRGAFLDVIYELLKRGGAQTGCLGDSRAGASPDQDLSRRRRAQPFPSNERIRRIVASRTARSSIQGRANTRLCHCGLAAFVTMAARTAARVTRAARAALIGSRAGCGAARGW
jgi:hypothetical protein